MNKMFPGDSLTRGQTDGDYLTLLGARGDGETAREKSKAAKENNH